MKTGFDPSEKASPNVPGSYFNVNDNDINKNSYGYGHKFDKKNDNSKPQI